MLKFRLDLGVGTAFAPFLVADAPNTAGEESGEKARTALAEVIVLNPSLRSSGSIQSPTILR